MVGRTETILCDGCGVEITWSPVVFNERRFCCVDCQQGRPCSCGDRMEEEDEHRGSVSAIIDSGGLI